MTVSEPGQPQGIPTAARAAAVPAAEIGLVADAQDHRTLVGCGRIRRLSIRVAAGDERAIVMAAVDEAMRRSG